MHSKRIEVAVGVIFNQSGQVLVAKRHPHQHQGDAYEFPGGKIEPGETVGAALKRELLEEVGIEVLIYEPWININHDYPDKSVCLQVHKVFSFIGEPYGCEGQSVQWVMPEDLEQLPLPEANHAIVKALNAEILAHFE